MSEVCCLLCNIDVTEGSIKVKRRRLSGSSARRAADVLDQLSVASYGTKLSLLVGKQDYICHKCRTMVEAFAELQERLKTKQQKINGLISKHFPVLGKRSRSKSEGESSSSDQPASISDATTPPRPVTRASRSKDQDVKVSVSDFYPICCLC